MYSRYFWHSAGASGNNKKVQEPQRADKDLHCSGQNAQFCQGEPEVFLIAV